MYLQADSWDQTQDFKLDASKIPDVDALQATLAAKNIRLVGYVDAAVSVKDRSKNSVYQDGKKRNAFIKSTISSGNPDGYLVNTKNGCVVFQIQKLAGLNAFESSHSDVTLIP